MLEPKQIKARPLPRLVDKGVCFLPETDIMVGTSQMYIHLFRDAHEGLVAEKTINLVPILRASGLERVTTLGAPSADEVFIYVVARGGRESWLVCLQHDLTIVSTHEAPHPCRYYCAEENLVHTPKGFYSWLFDGELSDWHLDLVTESEGLNQPGCFSSFRRLPSGSLLVSVQHGTSLWQPGVYEIDIDRWVGSNGMDYILGEWPMEAGGVYPLTQNVALVPQGNVLRMMEFLR